MSIQTYSAPVMFDAADVAAIPPQPLGHLPGVQLRPLWTDGLSKAGVLQIDAGHQLGSHAHRRHHHHVWVLEGEARVMDRVLGPGSYAHIPSGVEHDFDARDTEGCTVFYLYGADVPAGDTRG